MGVSEVRLSRTSPMRGTPWAPKALFGSGRQAQSPKPPLKSHPPLETPPPPKGGNRHLGPESIGNTRRQRRRRKFLQGAEADLHCDTMVQICGAPPPPQGGNRHFVIPPPPRGGTGPTKGGRFQGGVGVTYSGTDAECACSRPNGESPTVPPSPATGHAPSGSPNNGSAEATVEDPDGEFAPLHRQVFATCKLASDAARTVDGRFVAIPGRQCVYRPPPPPLYKLYKATFGTDLVCAAVQQGKTLN